MRCGILGSVRISNKTESADWVMRKSDINQANDLPASGYTSADHALTPSHLSKVVHTTLVEVLPVERHDVVAAKMWAW